MAGTAGSPTRWRPSPTANFLVNVDTEQSLAVRSRVHTPVVFDDPERFQRSGYAQTRELLDAAGAKSPAVGAEREPGLPEHDRGERA